MHLHFHFLFPSGNTWHNPANTNWDSANCFFFFEKITPCLHLCAGPIKKYTHIPSHNFFFFLSFSHGTGKKNDLIYKRVIYQLNHKKTKKKLVRNLQKFFFFFCFYILLQTVTTLIKKSTTFLSFFNYFQLEISFSFNFISYYNYQKNHLYCTHH